MITSREASELSALTRQGLAEGIEFIIEPLIKQAASKGETKINYYSHLPHPAIEGLKNLGYAVKDYCSQKDGDCYEISWSYKAMPDNDK